MKLFQVLLVFILLLSTSAFSLPEVEKKSQTVYVLGHAHMDPVYRWRWNEIENREIYNTFSNVLDAMETYPDLHFAQSYLLYYDTIQKNSPDLFDHVKQSIADKRWSVVGGQWVEPDETISSGESLIRQFLIALDFYTKNLGIDFINIAWSPDNFTGHPVTIPKIYAGCGVQNYVFSREAPDDKRVFWWESKDGSRILAYKIPGHYNPTFSTLPETIADWTDIANYDLPMITIGKGDHGGGPSDKDMAILDNISSKSNLHFEHISAEDYFQKLHTSANNWPVQKEEIGQHWEKSIRQGCLTSQAEIKKFNRYFENQLIAAEKFSAIGTMHKGKPFYPREDFLQAWRILLFNQFHDILPGTLTGLAANDVFKDYDKLNEIVSEQLNAGIENIGNRINTAEMQGIPLVVYNPHSWPVSQLVTADLKFITKPIEFSLKEPSGKNVAYSIVEKSADELSFKIEIDVKDIPPIGYKVYEVVEEKSSTLESDLSVSKNQIENNLLKIQWDATGITSIFSKELNKEMLKENANVLQLLEDNGNSWSLGLTGKDFEIEHLSKPELVLTSPNQVAVKWQDYFQSSKFTRYMTVKSNSNQIDFEMVIDWHSHNKLLRLAFPTAISNGDAYFDQPYGYVKRTESSKEVAAHKWIDYSNDEYGLGLLNDGKYGFSINDGTLAMSVIRGARDMDPRMDEGRHSFKYSLVVHKGDWRYADIPQKAWQFNQPLVAKQENHHPGEISGWKYKEQSFPLEKSFFKIDSDHVIISSLKVKQDAYDPNPIVLRIIETEGRDDDVTVHLPYNASSVEECNHLEQPIESRSEIKVVGNQFQFKIGHDQIRTFMVQF